LEGRISTTSIGQRKQAQRGVMKKLGRKEFLGLVFFFWEEEDKSV